jgi:hypothetical protein
MTFTEVFGGTTIYPSGVSYRAVALSADQTLAWPVETATNANIVAQIMDVTPSIAALSILMPPANEASVGETTLFFNAGSFAFTVKDNGGNTIVSIAPGLSYQVYLIGNATVNGTWRSTQYAAGTSSATAGSLVGAGIKAINTTLNQSMAVTSLNSNYTIGDADRSEAFLWSGGAGTLTLPSALSVGNDWFCHIRNSGTGAISLATTGGQLINGALSLAFNPGDSAIVICDGSGFFTIGFGQSASFAFDYVSIDLTSQTSPYTLAGANLNRIAYSFGGTLTANMTIHIPATFQQYWLANETLGGFAITVKVAGQTGVIIGNGVRAICYCNGTDLVDADTSSFSFPVSISQGGTGATNESGARVNLGGTSTGIAVFTAPSAASARSTLSAAASGANSDITSLSGLTTPLSVGQGGTGTATAFTAGSVVFGGASGVYSQDNANFFWDDANNRLGIGTTSPTYKIEARTDAVSGFNWVSSFNNTATGSFGAGFLSRSSVGSAYFYMRGDGLAYVENSTNNALGFATNATEKMRITAAGDVGIGATTVTERLQVNVGTGASGFEKGISLTNGVDANLFNYVTGTAATDKRAFITAGAANQALTFGTLYTERMRITSAGDVGIGTTAPSGYGKLAVIGGNLGVSQDSTTVTTIRGNANISNIGAFNSTGASLTFSTAPSGSGEVERVRITGTGDVGIGTITPQSKLHVSGGYITAGNVSSTAGSKIIGGDYSGAEHITTFGSEFSSGGPVVGYGVWPSTSAALAFVSSAAPALQRAAYTQTGNNHVWFTGASQTVAVGGAVTMSERMRLDGSGNLGLGTAPSGVRLDVNGSIRTTVGSGGTLSLFETDAVRANQLFSGADASGSFINATFSTGGTAVLRLQTANNERMRINAAGDVGIGTVTPANYAGFTTLDLDSSSNGGLLNIKKAGATVGYLNGSTGLLLLSQNNDLKLTSTGSTIIQFSTNSLERGRFDSAGNFGIGTASPAARLHVAGITRISDATNSTAVNIDASTTAGLTSIIAQFGGSQLAFGSAATERMRLDASGNLGIGVTGPVARLDVRANNPARGIISLGRNDGSTGQTGSQMQLSQNGVADWAFGQPAGVGDFAFWVGRNPTADGSEVLRLVSTGGITSPNVADAVGYKGLPQNSQTSGYTLALSDMGKHISITTGGVTIPANGAVAFPIGAAITIFNNSGTPQNIGITTDMLRQAGTANTGSRTLAQYGVATVLKVTSTVWVISGAGLS